MNIFVVTDTHFGHRALVDLGARPEGFETKIMKSWKQMVRPEDLVIHLGDVWICSKHEWKHVIRELPGKKVLTLGNHDKQSIGFYYERGFDFVCQSFSLHRFGMSILFSHMPMDGDHFDLNVHGHIHTARHREYEPKPNQSLLSLEDNGYQMTTLKGLVEREGK